MSDGGAAAAGATDAVAASIGAEVEAVWGIFKWRRKKRHGGVVVGGGVGCGRFCVRACGDGLKMGNLAPRKEKKISRLYFFDIF